MIAMKRIRTLKGCDFRMVRLPVVRAKNARVPPANVLARLRRAQEIDRPFYSSNLGFAKVSFQRRGGRAIKTVEREAGVVITNREAHLVFVSSY